HEREALHRQIAGTIEHLHPEPAGATYIELAYHFAEAREWEKTLEYARHAASYARTMHDPRAAIEHASRGLEAVCHLDIDIPVDLLIHRGAALADTGEFESAHRDLELARELSSRTGDQQQEWNALTRLGLLWAGRNYDRTGEMYQRAYELAIERADPRLIAHSLNRLGNWHTNLERSTDAIDAHQRALEIFERLDDPRGIAETNDLLGVARYLSGDLIGGTRHYQQASETFRNQGDLKAVASCLASLSMRGPTLQTSTMVTTDEPLSAGCADAEEALRIAREIGWRDGEAYALWMLGFSRGAAGDYERALENARLSFEISTAIGHRQWKVAACCVLGALRLDLLDVDQAIEWFDRARTFAADTRSKHWMLASTGFLVQANVAANNLERAANLLKSIEIAELPMQTLAQRLAWVGQIEWLVARERFSEALTAIDGVIETSPHASIERPPLRIALLRARVLLHLDKVDEAVHLLQSSRERAQALEAIGLTWRIDAVLAEAAKAQHDREATRAAIHRAMDTTSIIIKRLQDSTLRRSFRQAVSNAIPDAPKLTPNQENKLRFGGLTRRQREVAALVARGRTNRQIAELLSVSERTIESHITATLRTLNLSTRAQIAVWASGQDLDSSIERPPDSDSRSS
ncbi:MAG: LuxR C-terminal-related transcriptional regulator, partial [Chloroflexota bacterium]